MGSSSGQTNDINLQLRAWSAHPYIAAGTPRGEDQASWSDPRTRSPNHLVTDLVRLRRDCTAHRNLRFARTRAKITQSKAVEPRRWEALVWIVSTFRAEVGALSARSHPASTNEGTYSRPRDFAATLRTWPDRSRTGHSPVTWPLLWVFSTIRERCLLSRADYWRGGRALARDASTNRRREVESRLAIGPRAQIGRVLIMGN